jgi:hypothetical protein
MNDTHYICEKYLLDIKRGIEEMRDLIEELEGGGFDDTEGNED